MIIKPKQFMYSGTPVIKVSCFHKILYGNEAGLSLCGLVVEVISRYFGIIQLLSFAPSSFVDLSLKKARYHKEQGARLKCCMIPKYLETTSTTKAT